jgi:LacI family transcriptional regulator
MMEIMNAEALKRKRATIGDVARVAGVGTMTVSRVINNHPHVSDSVTKRVQTAIRKLNYKPNPAAQMLNGRPSATIGLIVPDLADPFFATLTHAVQQTAREHKYQVWIAASDSNISIEKTVVDLMMARAVDGILLVSSSPDDQYLKVNLSSGIPMVAIDRALETIQADSIEVENYQGSRSAVDHLIAHGRKKILCLGYNGKQSTIAQRIKGYRDAVKTAGLGTLVDVAEGADPPAIQNLRSALRKHKPDAIFTLNNVSTLHVLEALQELNIGVPSDVAVIGFDDVEAWRVTHPPLTAVRQPVREMGSLAVKILLDRVNNAGSSFTRTTLPTRLILRASCGCSMEQNQ